MVNQSQREDALAFAEALQRLVSGALAAAMAADPTIGAIRTELTGVQEELSRLSDDLASERAKNARQDDDMQFLSRTVIEDLHDALATDGGQQ